MTPEEIQKLLIYRDAMMLVLNKPSGVPVHKGFGGGETVDDWLEDLRFGLPRKPALAHRLDKDTSGCLVLGRHTQALKSLGEMFASGKIKKTYWAIVIGEPPQAEGRIDLPLVKKEEGRHRWHMKVGVGGQEAVTDYKIIKTYHVTPSHDGVQSTLSAGPRDEHGVTDGVTYTWLELKPQTGRTHQLRVHCSEVGCPILGDKFYGGISSPLPQGGDGGGLESLSSQALTLHPTSSLREEGKLYLHARSVEIPLYPKKPAIFIEAEAPAHMKDYFQ